MSIDQNKTDSDQTELEMGQQLEFQVTEGALFPVDFSLEAHDFVATDCDVIELVSKPMDSYQVKIEAEVMKSIQSIPKKMAFKIGEVAEMLEIKQYVLRYWETEFDQLKPRKSKFNQRVYTRKDVETAMLIKKLLYSDRFSIEGARTALKALKTSVKEEKKNQDYVVHTEIIFESSLHRAQDLLLSIQKLQNKYCVETSV